MLNEEYQALLLPILQDPYDWQPKLILADFLDENGKEKWAEYIRLCHEFPDFKHKSFACSCVIDMNGECDGCQNFMHASEKEQRLYKHIPSAYTDLRIGNEFSFSMPDGFISSITWTYKKLIENLSDLVLKYPIKSIMTLGVAPFRERSITDGTFVYYWQKRTEEQILRSQYPLPCGFIPEDVAEFQYYKEGRSTFWSEQEAIDDYNRCLLACARHKSGLPPLNPR